MYVKSYEISVTILHEFISALRNKIGDRSGKYVLNVINYSWLERGSCASAGIRAYEENVNPLHAKFFRGNKNIYLHFI